MKKSKGITIFFSSIVGILIICIGVIFYWNQWHQKQYFLYNLQMPLVELQGILAQQQRENWNHPELISNHVYIIMDDLEYVISENSFPSKVLSDEEKFMFGRIYAALHQLPTNETYHLAQWRKDDIKKAKIVNEALMKAKLEMETTIYVDWDIFMAQCKILDEELLKLTSLQNEVSSNWTASFYFSR